MEQDCGTINPMSRDLEPLTEGHWPGPEPAGSANRVYLGILRDLENGSMVPGQRLAETDLATRFAVGRNAVREAMQHLAVRGVVDLSPNRSPAIRRLDLSESLEVLEVAMAMSRVAVRAAAAAYRPGHEGLLDAALDALERAAAASDPAPFSGARRSFYRALLTIGGNRELQRLFPAIGMHVINAQYRSFELQRVRLVYYRLVAAAVRAGDPDAAECAVIDHVAEVGLIIRGLVTTGG